MLNSQELLSLHTNQRLLVSEMQSRKIDVNIECKEIEFIKAEYKGHVEWILDRDSSVTPYSVSIICGDKYITKKILQRENVSVPEGEKFFSSQIKIALMYAKKIGFPVVLKPVFGSHGDNVFMDIENEQELEKLIKETFIKTPSKPFIIEKQFEGKEYRIFITKDGKYAVLHRDPAHVIGDGVHNISELIDLENIKREERLNSLCPIQVDEISKIYMDKMSVNLFQIPGNNEKVYIRHNSNVAKGGICVDYTEKVHSSAIEICKKILDTFSGLSYLGIDYMSSDITGKQTNDIYNVVEINTVPGLHMHMKPAIGKTQDVAKYMVDIIFPETRSEDE